MKRQIEIHKLVREHIQLLKPYASARDEYKGKVGVFLDANENPYGSAIDEKFNRYPDPLQRELKEKLAGIKGVRSEQIFLGNGSDEAIDLLFRIFCEPKRDHVMLLPPTYGMYQVSADINQVASVAVPLTDDFELETAEIIASLRPGTKMVFVCTPNNPTGNVMKQSAIELILQKAPGLVVVDEAYIDFAPHTSLLSLLDEYQNLVVLQTFSKAWGLANLRLGMAFAHPEIIELFNKIKPPYNVNGLTQKLALESLRNEDKKDQMVNKIKENRRQLVDELGKLPMVKKVFPSDANFVLARVVDADGLYQRLIDQQLIVRNRSRLSLCEGCLRITVGTPEENEALIQTLKKMEMA